MAFDVPVATEVTMFDVVVVVAAAVVAAATRFDVPVTAAAFGVVVAPARASLMLVLLLSVCTTFLVLFEYI